MYSVSYIIASMFKAYKMDSYNGLTDIENRLVVPKGGLYGRNGVGGWGQQMQTSV